MTEAKDDNELSALDAVRLLCNAVQMVQYLDKTGEGMMSAHNYTVGEQMLCYALMYLAWGDTIAAREHMKDYDTWRKTGVAPWPYVDKASPE